MTSGEGSKLLRALLKQYAPEDPHVGEVSSHSLKATVLSWLRKFGVDPFHSKVAGYHKLQSESSMFSYARDNIAATLRVIDGVMCAVRTESFRPDLTRSGYFDLSSKPAVCPLNSDLNPSASNFRPTEDVHVEDSACFDVAQTAEGFSEDGFVEVQVPAEVPLCDDWNQEQFEAGQPGLEELEHKESEESESSSSQTSSGSDSEVLESIKILSEASRQPVARSAEHFFVHKLNQTLHKAHADSSNKVACGRLLHTGYVKFDVVPHCMFHKCGNCFGSERTVDLT